MSADHEKTKPAVVAAGLLQANCAMAEELACDCADLIQNHPLSVPQLGGGCSRDSYRNCGGALRCARVLPAKIGAPRTRSALPSYGRKHALQAEAFVACMPAQTFNQVGIYPRVSFEVPRRSSNPREKCNEQNSTNRGGYPWKRTPKKRQAPA